MLVHLFCMKISKLTAFQIQKCYKIQTGSYPYKNTCLIVETSNQHRSHAANVFTHTAALSPPRRCDDLVLARHVGEGAVLGSEVHTVQSSGAGQGEVLQKRDHEEEYLHASQRFSDASSLS